MKTEATNLISWNELVFSNRNKQYGAYLLRKLYHDHLTFAFAISTLLILLWVGGFKFLNSLSKHASDFIKKDKPHVISQPPIIKIIETQRAEPIQQKTIKNERAFVATTKNVDTAPVTDLNTTVTSVTGSTDGTPTEGVADPSTGDAVIDIPIVETKKIHDRAEVMPEYEGGLEAMARFLGRKIKYPVVAKRNHDEGVVYVSFVVNEAGEVTDVKVAKGISKECDAEAIRVVSLMNKWKSGLQHGVPVSVRMMLPIKFKMDQ